MSKYSYLNRVRVEVEQLRKGMYVGELDIPWEKSSFLFQGFNIEDDETISKLRNECSHVFVDFKDEQEYENHLLEIEKSAESGFSVDASLSDEFPKALKVVKNAARELKLLMRKIQRGDDIQLSEVQSIVSSCLESLERNNRALVILCNIKHKIFYSAEHPLRVAIFAMAFAKNLKMSEEQLIVMGTSAMLHDVGKFAIPERVLNKTEELTKQEKLMLKRHPIQSYKMLDQVIGVTEAIKEVALSHHERADGKGYPRNIPQERVSRFAKIVSIIDAYDAITSDRPHKEGKSPSYAFKILNNYKGSKFDELLVSEFVKWMGVMPVGSLVEMATGEIGIVLKNCIQQKLRPKVLLVTDERKKQGFQKVVDLSQMDLHASGKEYRVKSVLPNDSFGINIEHYLDSQSYDTPKWLSL